MSTRLRVAPWTGTLSLPEASRSEPRQAGSTVTMAGAGPTVSRTEMPLWKVSGHQYFMPLQLSLFLCKLLGLPDGQGLAASSITRLSPPPSPARAPHPGLGCGPSSPLVCTAGHSPVLGHRGSQRPGHCTGRLTGGRTSWREGHFSARLCSLYFNARRACEAGRTGLMVPAYR